MAAEPSPTPPPTPGVPTGELEAMASQLKKFAALDWRGMPGAAANEAIIAIEGVNRALAALQAEAVSAAEASGMWALDGHRTFTSWLTNYTGTTRASSTRTVKLAKSLKDTLPHTRQALADGKITRDHAELISRKCTKTEKHRELLLHPESGEEFLVASATQIDANQFSRVVDQWAVMADPESADRGWREASSKEEVFLSPTMDGYLLSGWLSTVNGAIVEEALNSHMGRKSADDLRSPKQRRAAALVSLARLSLDSGAKLPSARIRPHLTVTMGYETIEALAEATVPAVQFESHPLIPDFMLAPSTGNGTHAAYSCDWMKTWQPGDDHAINTGLDYERLEGVPPATIGDETPLPPAVLARLTCESMLARVVFGPEGTVLDSGREERIFPAHQVRAIIARDRHCQYPGCDAPPGFGEIHHSAEWFKHNGSTHVDLGILLCWHHHARVHERAITILRVSGEWLFIDRTGRTIKPPEHAALMPPEPDPPPF